MRDYYFFPLGIDYAKPQCKRLFHKLTNIKAKMSRQSSFHPCARPKITHKSGVGFEVELARLEEMSRQHERTRTSEFRDEWRRLTEAAIPGNA